MEEEEEEKVEVEEEEKEEEEEFLVADGSRRRWNSGKRGLCRRQFN